MNKAEGKGFRWNSTKYTNNASFHNSGEPGNQPPVGAPRLWLDDGDIKLYHGDALETVRQLPDDSVDCVVTSPPYWGLRDYGTGEWDGGDADCDHTPHVDYGKKNDTNAGAIRGGPYKDVCGKCGARRVDRQMGLEPTPDLFVQGMVELFREIRRVLAPHGTCWVNLGDSYASGTIGRNDADRLAEGLAGGHGGGTTAPRMGTHTSRDEWGKPKDLVGIPWRVAFALQADGWWLRSDIIWAKPNPMPESVTDRPTKAHEYIFLLTKQPRYWFDTEAIREPHTAGNTQKQHTQPKERGDARTMRFAVTERYLNPAGRSPRSVWQIATQPYPEAHFATYPEELARRCILAGCPVRVCRVCDKPSERIIDVRYGKSPAHGAGSIVGSRGVTERDDTHMTGGMANKESIGGQPRVAKIVDTVGWSDCGHNNWRPGVTLDPFIGSGTTAKVARDHQRHAIGIDLNSEYLELAARRLQQLSLLT